MAEPTIQLGGGNWAGKTDNLLGYYKEGERFYKQDFTFSRSTTGTYTDSDGYIQEMPYNLLQQSNDFDTTWGTSSATISSGESGYDGTNNAWSLNSSSEGYLFQYLTNETSNTLSIYAKAGSVNNIRLRFFGTSNGEGYFNLSNGTKGTTSGLADSSIENVGNGWYRCNISINTTISLVRIYPSVSSSSSSGTNGFVYIQDAQINKGTSAKTYFPTTTRLNMPRVDYLNNTNGSLILEPQRTNLITYSSDFSQWSKYNLTVGQNATTSPNGLLNADKLIEDSSNSTHFAWLQATTISATHSFSIFAKVGERKRIALRDNQIGNSAVFDLESGSVVSGSGGSIVYFGNGFYRITLKGNYASAGTRHEIYILPDNATTATTSYQGDGSSGVYVYGAQVEQGDYPTSIINTEGSSVTRNADACSISNVADKINSSEGVLFAEIAALTDVGDGTTRLSISDGSQDNNVTIGYSATNTLRTIIRSGASNQALMTSSQTITNYLKVAVKYKVNDFALWVNGVEVATDTSGLAPVGLSELAFDRGDEALYFFGKCKQIQVYNTALSDSELATLTTI